MDPAVLEEWMMTGLVSILIIFMGFIVWDLAKKIQGRALRLVHSVLRTGAGRGRLRGQKRGHRHD